MTYNNSRHKYGVLEDGSVLGNLIDAGEKVSEDSNGVYISGDYNIVIPAGFTVSATENSIENGLVVIDGTSKQNEWVWVPVSDSDFSIMFGTANDDGWTMLGTSVKTKYKSLGTTLGNRSLDRGNPGQDTINDVGILREPDVLAWYDTDQGYRTQAGFGDLTDMATNFKNDYKDMMNSIKENKGFYIGRYELGRDSNWNPQVKADNVLCNKNWYESYSACKSFSSGNVESRMIWGCQWDQVCRFVSSYKDNNGVIKARNLDNSTDYGNYSGSSDLKTGTRNNCITNNIYDMAGNCWEWTQENYSYSNRVIRGRRLQ